MPETSGAKKQQDIPGLRSVSTTTIYAQVFGNADREVGGVLVGRRPRGGGIPMITGAIEAMGATEERATLTFTQETWQHVHRVLDERYPEEESIVGWYHSHPGFGIFLSEHDLFIHRNFFSGESQIAVVVDPLAGTEGAFAWRDGDVAKLFERATPHEWTASPPRSLDSPVAPAPSSAVAQPPSSLARPRPTYPLLPLIIAGLAGIGLGLGGSQLVKGDGATTSVPATSATPPPKAVAPDQPTAGRPSRGGVRGKRPTTSRHQTFTVRSRDLGPAGSAEIDRGR